ncbi:MAG TPA: transketolase, partial [Burkholderiales bacterium]|nr:transketolase [Burkholderiales bacterium]
DGKVEGWFTDDTPKRFEAYGWHVVPAVDGHDVDAVERAIVAAKAVADRPSLICCKTVIGKGAPNKAGSHDVHGAALGEKEVAATRAAIGWEHVPFEIPQNVYAGWDARARGAEFEGQWNRRFAAYEKQHPQLAREFLRRMAGELPTGWKSHCDALLAKIEAKAETIATRKASQNAIEGLAPVLPEFVGGSADLTGSNLTNWSGASTVGASGGGNYLSYGVREFGMAAIANGMALHGGLLPFCGTFLTFSDYARNALRMAALMKLRNIFVFTHDSIGLGEDGPTHQSVEHVSSLRLIPNLDLWRPCDTVESALAWTAAVGRRDGPSALVFSRQNLQFQKRDARALADIARGAYVLADCEGKPQALLLATGSEVQLAMEAQAKLAAEGVRARVVSMPSTNVFDRQDAAYRDAVLPRGVPRVAVEAGVSDYWRKYVGLEGAVIGIDRYGESAPGAQLFKHFGFTVDNVVAAVKSAI